MLTSLIKVSHATYSVRSHTYFVLQLQLGYYCAGLIIPPFLAISILFSLGPYEVAANNSDDVVLFHQQFKYG